MEGSLTCGEILHLHGQPEKLAQIEILRMAVQSSLSVPARSNSQRLRPNAG